MNPNTTQAYPTLGEVAYLPTELPIPHLVAQVFEAAPPAVRVSLLEQLLQPLGALSLVVVANGIFAKIRFSSGWPDMHLRIEDVQKVQAQDIVALVERVQMVSVSSVDGLAKMLTASPVATSSAAAALLITVLMQRARTRRDSDRETNSSLRGF
jgi:hypothetical protein